MEEKSTPNYLALACLCCSSCLMFSHRKFPVSLHALSWLAFPPPVPSGWKILCYPLWVINFFSSFKVWLKWHFLQKPSLIPQAEWIILFFMPSQYLSGKAHIAYLFQSLFPTECELPEARRMFYSILAKCLTQLSVMVSWSLNSR